MHLARIDGDQIACTHFDRAAPGRRDLRAGVDKADAELVMRVAGKAARRPRRHGDDGTIPPQP